MKKIFTLVLFLVAAVIRSNGQGLVINEIDYDQPSADSAEFIELYNSSSNAINLSNYSVILFNGSATSNTRYDSIALPNRMLAPAGYFVICAGNAGKVANCDTARTGFTIQNGSPDAVVIRDNTTLNIVDAVSYEGTCIPPYSEGNGVPLAESDTLNSGGPGSPNNFLGISRYPDGMDTNDDSTDFHRYCSTPGTANVNISASCGPVSVKTITLLKNEFSVYPNPSSGIINISLGGNQIRNVSFIVSDLLGNEIRKISLKNYVTNQQVDLSEFQDGIYFIKIKSETGESVHRIILKK